MARKKIGSTSAFNRRGNAVLDTMFTIVIIFVFIIMCIYGYKIFLEMKPDILDDIPADRTQSRAALNEIESRYPSVIDGLVILLFIGIWIMGITASFMIDSHPIFFAVSAFLVIFVIIAGMMLGNFYEELFEDPELSEMSGYFPVTHWLMTHLMHVGIVVGFSILLVLYGKSQTGQ